MRRTVVGRLLAYVYPHVPARGRLLSWVVQLEGGQMYSRSLRTVLERHFGVKVGEYSYGSLLEPGRADRGTYVGRYVSAGPGVRRFGASHPVKSASLHPFGYNPRLGLVNSDRDVLRTGCVIEHDCWIGANVMILPKCRRIGIGAIVGAGSVVIQDVPDFAVVVGNPGRVVRTRLSPEMRARIASARLWNLEPQEFVAALRAIGEDDWVEADG